MKLELCRQYFFTKTPCQVPVYLSPVDFIKTDTVDIVNTTNVYVNFLNRQV